MPTLVTGDGNRLHIFLNSAVHNFLYRTVVAQVNYLYPRRLNNTAHDIDGSVVAVEQGGSRNDANMVFWFVRGFGM